MNLLRAAITAAVLAVAASGAAAQEVPPTAAQEKPPAAAQEMPPMAKRLGCVACHAIDKKIIGPSWKDVAEKYTGHGVKTFTFKDKEYPLIEGLVMKVSQGGSGNWGTVPMTPNDPKGVHNDDITELVKFEQNLAEKK